MSNPTIAEPATAAPAPAPRGPSPLVRTLVKLVSLAAIGALLFVFHDPRQAQPMEIVWGNGVAPLNEKWMGCKGSGAWWSDLVHVLRHDPLSVKLRCPYTRTISVGHLLGSSDDADVRAALILAHPAAALGRQREAMVALERALRSPEPAPQIYEDVIVGYERTGNITAALSWTDKASVTFGGAPGWTPVKIRLLRRRGAPPRRTR